MLTKLKAASIASKSNTQTIIASGNESSILLKIANSEKVGTLLTTSEDTLQAKKQWLANQAYLKGSVTIDSGAVTAIIKSGKSLLPIGVKSITGEFKRGEIISCIDLDGKEIARGLSNYDSIQATSIMGKSSEEIGELLDCKDEDELIHRDNMILI